MTRECSFATASKRVSASYPRVANAQQTLLNSAPEGWVRVRVRVRVRVSLIVFQKARS